VARYIGGRIAQAVVVVAIVATIVFFLAHLAPGDPFSAAMDNPNVSETVRAKWRESYGLDKPLGEQYIRYMTAVARGDLGWSFSLQRPVRAVLADALPNTLLLMVIALIAGFVLGIAAAVTQVVRKGRLVDKLLSGVSLFFFAIPEFWLATMLLLLLAYQFRIFPIGGMVDPVMHDSMSGGGKIADLAKHVVLPALTLALLAAAVVARYQRAALLDTLPEDYIRTARAKGLNTRQIVRQHALRNALLPVITLAGLAFPALVTGAVFVEKVFSWPGMGLVIVNSIGTRDYPLLLAGVIGISALVAVGSLAADLLYAAADPRVRDAV
jgi:peptide/nickel transport system permease protein